MTFLQKLRASGVLRPAMLRGYTEPMPHPRGTQSAIVGASCWLFAADYAARDSWWAVLDRYVAAAAVAVVPTAPPALLCVAAAAASRLSASTRQWIVAAAAAERPRIQKVVTVSGFPA